MYLVAKELEVSIGAAGHSVSSTTAELTSAANP